MNKLEGRVAIITGAAVGNGQAFCQRLAQEGATVVIADIADAEEAIEKVKSIGGNIIALRTDVTDEIQTQELARKTIERFGRIDILVNNVGLYHEEPFELISYKEWKRMLEVNLDGLFLTTKACLLYTSPSPRDRTRSRMPSSA